MFCFSRITMGFQHVLLCSTRQISSYSFKINYRYKKKIPGLVKFTPPIVMNMKVARLLAERRHKKYQDELPKETVIALDYLDKMSAESGPYKDAHSPYQSEKTECILCKHKIPVDYRNPRLLSQFISSFTGRLYERNITGLCEYQYQRLKVVIKKSRRVGLMPVFNKNPQYLADPALFNPMNPKMPNPY